VCDVVKPAADTAPHLGPVLVSIVF
jgi:hypothetical protein